MDKVVLTSEQMDALRFVRRWNEIDFNIDKHRSGWIDKRTKCLNDLNLNDFLKVYYTDSYEIRDDYKIGDYVELRSGSIGKITETRINQGRGLECFVETLSATPWKGWYKVADINKLVGEEEVKSKLQSLIWDEYSRQVWELKENDILVNKKYENDCIRIKRIEENELIVVYAFLLDEYKIMNLSEIKKNFEIHAFSEDIKNI